MAVRPAFNRRNDAGNHDCNKKLRTRPVPERHYDLARTLLGKFGLKPAPATATVGFQKLTKLLLNVTIQRSLGPVRVVMSAENTVRDLIRSAMEIYVKEKRRPFLTVTDPRRFELHYSQFSLESLKTDEKLVNLGSRNFFLCPKPSNSVSSPGSQEANNATKLPFSLTELMNFLL